MPKKEKELTLLEGELKGIKEKVETMRNDAQASFTRYGENYQLGRFDACNDILNVILSQLPKEKAEPYMMKNLNCTGNSGISEDELLAVKEESIEKGLEEKIRFNKIWHTADETPDVDKPIILMTPRKTASLGLWDGKTLISCTLGGGHNVICRGDRWAYIEDLCN